MESIKAARKRLNITQLQLAKRLEPPVSACYISQIENGYYTTPNPEIMRQLGLILGVNVVGNGPLSEDPFSDLTDFERQTLIEHLRCLRVLDPVGRLKAGALILARDEGVDEIVMNAFALARQAAMRVLVWNPDEPEAEAGVGWVIAARARHLYRAWLWEPNVAVQCDMDWYHAIRAVPKALDMAEAVAQRNKELA